MIDVHNTFSPGQEIMSPEKFAGRKVNIAQAIRALCRPGTSILVYGERGVGKTSFVEMVKLLAQGQIELLYKHDLKSLMPVGGFQYKVVSVECDEAVETTEDVLQRLLTSPEGFSSLVSSRITKLEYTQKESIGISLLKKLFTYSLSTDDKFTFEQFKEESIFELFTNVVQSVCGSILTQKEGLLIVIDEFDRVKEKQKISSLIKTLSKNRVKFLISGIATTYFQLIHDHASIERQLYLGKINIKPMTEDEIKMLFKLAEEHNHNDIRFQSALVRDIGAKSFGFPYYVQLFGQLALDQYIEIYALNSKGTVTSSNFQEGLRNFTYLEPKLEKTYIDILGNDPARELMIKGMANLTSKEIRQSEVFKYCVKRGLTNPKQTLATLLGFKDPEVLRRLDKERITFNNPLFRIFASAREPEFLNHDPQRGLIIG